MKDLIKEFEEFKKSVFARFSASLGEAPAAAFLSASNDYQAVLSDSLARLNKEKAELKDENDILRSLSGCNDTEVLAQSLRQGEELKFLREQLVSAAKERKDIGERAASLQLALEETKQELQKCRRSQEEDQNRFQNDLGSLTEKMKAFESKIQEQQVAFVKEKERILQERQEQGA